MSVKILIGKKAPEVAPTAGMGATICMYSDRHAATVIKVSPSGKTVTVQQDTARRIDSNGMSEMQEYEYSRNLSGSIEVFRLTRSGIFRNGQSGHRLGVGHRREYYDYTF